MRVDPLDALKRGHARLWLFLIGINDYDDARLCSLRFAVADCQDFAAAMHGVTTVFPQRELLIHCGTQHQPFTLAQLHNRLDRLFDPIEGVQPEDTVLFYFAGHGAVDPQTQQLYLCLSSTQLDDLPATGLHLKDFLDRLQTAQVGKQVLIIDACHCDKVKFFNTQLETTLHFYATQRREFYALLSCNGLGQQSWEFTDLGHGVFTYYLIEGLRGAAIDDQGQVDVELLYRYVRDQTEQWVRDQLGKIQVPGHIKSGSRDIVIGVQPPEDQEMQEIGALSEREKRYRQSVWQALKQEYPLSGDKLDQLHRFADELLLPQESIKKIEADEIQSFQRDLENYKQRAISILHQQYPHDFDLFAPLRQKIGFSARVLEPLEIEAFRVFRQHRQIYQSYVAESYCQYNLLPAATYRRLQRYKQKYGLSEAVAQSLELEVLDKLNQQKWLYRSQLLTLMTEHGIWRRDLRRQLDQTQAELGFSNAVAAAIEQETIATIPPSQVPSKFSPLTPHRPPIATIALSMVTVGTLSSVLSYQQHSYQAAAQTRDRIANLQGNHQYQACINAAIAVPQTSAIYPEVQAIQRQCEAADSRAKIARAKELAQQGQFQAAISLSTTLSPEDAVALDVQQLINSWAQSIWRVAQKHYNKGELRIAIAMLRAIPRNTSVYTERQFQVQDWQQDWERNRSYLETAKQARAMGDWTKVIQKGKQVYHPYWKQQAQPLMIEARLAQQAEQEAMAQRVIAQRTTPMPRNLPAIPTPLPQQQPQVARTAEFSAKPQPMASANPVAAKRPVSFDQSVNVRATPVPSPQPRVASRTGRPPAPSPVATPRPALPVLPAAPPATIAPEYSQVAKVPAVQRSLPPTALPPVVDKSWRSTKPKLARRKPVTPDPSQSLLTSRLKSITQRSEWPTPSPLPEILRPQTIQPTIASPKRSTPDSDEVASQTK
jgi:hypothetical protein